MDQAANTPTAADAKGNVNSEAKPADSKMAPAKK